MTVPFRITLGGYQGPGSVHTRALEVLRDALDRLSEGRIDVMLRANMGEDGHKTADLPGLVEAGEIDLCYVASSYLAGRVPALSLFDMPFAAPDRERAIALMDGELGQRFGQEIEANTSLALLGIWDNGLRHIATADRVLRSPSDCAGLVLRTLPNEDHQRLFRALGFEPQVIDATELHAAVADGKVDAQENPLTNTLNFDLHKALPVITRTRHLMGIALVLVNRHWLAALPDDLRTTLCQAVAEATEAQRASARKEDQDCEDRLILAGATLHDLTDAERSAWQQAAAPQIARHRARLDPDLLALFDRDSSSNRKALA
jgi:C4-dicarboxylate-binding protein DctP